MKILWENRQIFGVLNNYFSPSNTQEINRKFLRLISCVFLHIIVAIRLERGQKLCVKQGQ